MIDGGSGSDGSGSDGSGDGQGSHGSDAPRRQEDVVTGEDGFVTVYWRPGCGFCAALLRGLERQDLVFARVDIWDRPEAAAFVRSVAGGNETVPTVVVGDVALVNPSSREVLRTVARLAPHRLPAGMVATDLEPRGTERLWQRVFGT